MYREAMRDDNARAVEELVSGHRFTIPGSGQLVADRATSHGRQGWAPGIVALAVEVELAHDAVDAMGRAVAALRALQCFPG